MENHIDILKKELKDKKDSEYKTLKIDVRDQKCGVETWGSDNFGTSPIPAKFIRHNIRTEPGGTRVAS